jgi:hypothetical protein
MAPTPLQFPVKHWELSMLPHGSFCEGDPFGERGHAPLGSGVPPGTAVQPVPPLQAVHPAHSFKGSVPGAAKPHVPPLWQDWQTPLHPEGSFELMG